MCLYIFLIQIIFRRQCYKVIHIIWQESTINALSRNWLWFSSFLQCLITPSLKPEKNNLGLDLFDQPRKTWVWTKRAAWSVQTAIIHELTRAPQAKNSDSLKVHPDSWRTHGLLLAISAFLSPPSKNFPPQNLIYSHQTPQKISFFSIFTTPSIIATSYKNTLFAILHFTCCNGSIAVSSVHRRSQIPKPIS